MISSSDARGNLESRAGIVRYNLNRVTISVDPSGLKDKKSWTWMRRTDEKNYNPVTISVAVEIGGGSASISAIFNNPTNAKEEYPLGSGYHGYNNEDDTSQGGIRPTPGKGGSHDQLPTWMWEVPLEDGENHIRIRPPGGPNNDSGLEVIIETDEFGNVMCLDAHILHDLAHILE